MVLDFHWWQHKEFAPNSVQLWLGNLVVTIINESESKEVSVSVCILCVKIFVNVCYVIADSILFFF